LKVWGELGEIQRIMGLNLLISTSIGGLTGATPNH
jgi:hypothetical protein